MISHRNLATGPEDGEEVNLTDFRGQRVWFIFTKAMTPGCTVQACGLRDNMDDLKKPALKCWASAPINRKNSPVSPKELLNFTLLSDENHQVCEQFGVWGEKSFMGKPTTGSTGLVSSSMPMAKSNTSLMISKPAITTTWC
ncbi:redoxin domain-containing protein [Klebsiella pneumoniae]|uniref:Thioredoxin-dependent peroxiredoxin Bcp n=1 Tax=Klebsiella pneumoniae TaxID=573 RepID=A0A939NRV6_KLEPN|nr:redoxin domain-containing protein [Klebsiella pneumoniae]